MVRLGPMVLGVVVSVLVAGGVASALWTVIAFDVTITRGGPVPLMGEAAVAAVATLGLAAGLVAWAAAGRVGPAPPTPAAAEPRPPSS